MTPDPYSATATSTTTTSSTSSPNGNQKKTVVIVTTPPTVATTTTTTTTPTDTTTPSSQASSSYMHCGPTRLDSRFSFRSNSSISNVGGGGIDHNNHHKNKTNTVAALDDEDYDEDADDDDELILLENIHETVSKEQWFHQPLSIVVVGASGDLAKKKTYPSLFHLYSEGLLPSSTVIWGYARSKKTHDELRAHLRPHLVRTTANNNVIQQDEGMIDQFLQLCFYHSGKSYGDEVAYKSMMDQIESFEESNTTVLGPSAGGGGGPNRLFYLAVPPNVFAECGVVIRRVGMTKSSQLLSSSSSTLSTAASSLSSSSSSYLSNSDKIRDNTQNVDVDRDCNANWTSTAVTGDGGNGRGISDGGWTRIVIEKPFGQDLASCEDLLGRLASQFHERHLYRIDHYLGKEIVQNLMIFRFGNSLWEPLWDAKSIESVTISFKEPFGTEGRGGYFDQFGIIRDILQNHLLQVLTLFAMEPPVNDTARSIRNEKVEVLKNMDILSLEDVLLGQYDGYIDDPTIQNKESNCPTYAAIRCNIHTPRWEGVPFILEAGKALNEKLCEIRVRFRGTKNRSSVRRFAKQLGPSELVMRLQPDPAIEVHTNIKSPGLSSQPMMSTMKMNYEHDIPDMSNPDAYTRLLLDVLRGNQGSFVRDDELRRSWELFTPLLHAIDFLKIRPESYKYGSTGPPQRKMWMEVMSGGTQERHSKL